MREELKKIAQIRVQKDDCSRLSSLFLQTSPDTALYPEVSACEGLLQLALSRAVHAQ